ncbi:uncharacterized protein [Maniola hyperantus]|uniref:uncharacterized protein n=1 Tax=Aphantopus hyperantus TaxID=2795564 RepID=UPI001568B4CA|nr:uncharacterized protein LOC117993166 [Maniola hyperantus]
MIKFMCVLFAFALLVEGLPAFPRDLAEAARIENWEQFQKLLELSSFGVNWPPALAGSVESLRPSEGTHVYGHSVSAYKNWSNINGNISEDGKGIEVENDDGLVSKRIFKP